MRLRIRWIWRLGVSFPAAPVLGPLLVLQDAHQGGYGLDRFRADLPQSPGGGLAYEGIGVFQPFDQDRDGFQGGRADTSQYASGAQPLLGAGFPESLDQRRYGRRPDTAQRIGSGFGEVPVGIGPDRAASPNLFAGPIRTAWLHPRQLGQHGLDRLLVRREGDVRFASAQGAHPEDKYQALAALSLVQQRHDRERLGARGRPAATRPACLPLPV